MNIISNTPTIQVPHKQNTLAIPLPLKNEPQKMAKHTTIQKSDPISNKQTPKHKLKKGSCIWKMIVC